MWAEMKELLMSVELRWEIFKLDLEQEKNNWKLEVKGYMVRVSWGEELQ